MAMTVLNSSAAQLSLGELNRNINKVGKALTKVSTGQKINSAADDASAYSISEQMRAKIRALEQDVQNVQNGSSMLKTALGGIQNVVDELRSLKELAIDAANDSNTDEDRAVMQKVLKQKQANIDAIAERTTFNNKSLLDGTYSEPRWKPVYTIECSDPSNLGGVRGLETENSIHKSMVLPKTDDVNVNSLVNKNVNINVIEKLNLQVKGLASKFEAMHSGVTFADGTRAVETRDTALYAQRPESIVCPENITSPEYPTQIKRPELETEFEKITRDSVVPNRNFIRSSGGAPLAVRLDFSGATDAQGNSLFSDNGKLESYGIDQLQEQGFTILNSASSHFVNIKFVSGSDAVWRPINQLEDAGGAGEDTSLTGDFELEVGIDDCDGMTPAEFARSIFQKLYTSESRQTKIGLLNRKLGSGLSHIHENASNFILSQQYNLRMAKDTEGNVYLTMDEPYVHNLGILDEGILQIKYMKIGEDFYGIGERHEYKEDLGNPLWIQHGTQAGQHINVFINSMYNSALGTDAIDVTTRDRAKASIDYIDVALGYALDQATSVGACLKRMEYTEANVTTENENVQAAESTMRDADMAREMTDYAKNNVLFQASQSMLAQSNQMMSSVLSLLQ